MNFSNGAPELIELLKKAILHPADPKIRTSMKERYGL